MSEHNISLYASRDVGDRGGMIGGSSWNDLFAVEPWGCRRRFWLSYMGTKQDEDFKEAVWTKRGKDLEEVILKMYSEKFGVSLATWDTLVKKDWEFDGDIPDWSWPHLDGIIEYHPKMKGMGVVDAKCLFPKSCTELLTKGITDGYAMQLNHYLAATGYQWGALAILDFMNWEVHELIYEFDEDEWKAQKARAAEELDLLMYSKRLPDILPNGLKDEPHKSCQTCRYFHTCRSMK